MLTGELRDQAGIRIWRIDGELDALTVALFHAESAFYERLEGPVVIDVTDVHFIDSRGLTALVGWIRRCHDRGANVVICCERPFMVRLLRLAGIEAIAPLVSSLDGAHAVLGQDAVAESVW